MLGDDSDSEDGSTEIFRADIPRVVLSIHPDSIAEPFGNLVYVLRVVHVDREAISLSITVPMLSRKLLCSLLPTQFCIICK